MAAKIAKVQARKNSNKVAKQSSKQRQHEFAAVLEGPSMPLSPSGLSCP
jgi:hypothetical protein